jgi:hypothetical protein
MEDGIPMMIEIALVEAELPATHRKTPTGPSLRRRT